MKSPVREKNYGYVLDSVHVFRLTVELMHISAIRMALLPDLIENFPCAGHLHLLDGEWEGY